MNYLDYLKAAGEPKHMHLDAIASLQDAERRARGLLWHKLKVRLFRAHKIAKMIPWHADRLIDVRPDLASWDIEPVTKITAQGDKGGWGPGQRRGVQGAHKLKAVAFRNSPAA